MSTAGFFGLPSFTNPIPGAVAFFVGVAGWFYLFYSRAAFNLSAIENQSLNRRRVALRRVGAAIMLLLALGIAIGSYSFDTEHPTFGFLVTWLLVMGLVMAMVILGLMDLRLTLKLRRRDYDNRKEL